MPNVLALRDSAADSISRFEDGDFAAVAEEDICTSKTGEAGTDNGDFKRTRH